MIYAYKIDRNLENISAESVVILDGSLSQNHGSEDTTAGEIASYVFDAARKYSELNHLSVYDDPTSVSSLQSAEIEVEIEDASVVICAFDTSAHSLLDMVMSERLIAEAERSELLFSSNSSLVRFLNGDIWTYLASTQIWVTRSVNDLKICCEDTYLSLTEFRAALRLFIHNNIKAQMQNVEVVKETILWRWMIQSRRSSGVTETNYTVTSGRQPSEVVNTYSNHTFPRRQTRNVSRRLRSQSDSTDLFTPRTMPIDEPADTDKYTRYIGHYDSETSNST